MSNTVDPAEAGSGQESIWHYPRPPRLEESGRHVQLVFNGEVIADSRRCHRPIWVSGASETWSEVSCQ